MPYVFRDRRDAGRQLSTRLMHYAGQPGVIVLGLPRGGVPVAAEVAHAIGAPLDVFVVRKLGLPGNDELAMGAIATGGVCVLNREYLEYFRVSAVDVERVRMKEQRELERREWLYRGDRPPIDARGSTVIVVDDGLATGATMRAAVDALRQQHPLRIVVAVPVASRDTCDAFGDVVDECECLYRPANLGGVGQWYLDFEQTTDDEVRTALDRVMRAPPESLSHRAAHHHVASSGLVNPTAVNHHVNKPDAAGGA